MTGEGPYDEVPGSRSHGDDQLRALLLGEWKDRQRAYQEHVLWVARMETRTRIFLASVLVLLTIVAAVIAVLQTDANSGQKVSQLLTPLAALTGIAIGYFFGQGTRPPAAPKDASQEIEQFEDTLARR